MRSAVIFLALACGVLSGPVEDEATQEFVTGNHKFTAAIYKEIIKKEKGNIIVSPLSAETVLALTNEGARGETSREFVTGLSLPSSNEKIQKAFKTFLPKLKRSEDDLKLLSANKIYVGKDVKLVDSFRDIATTIYDSGVDNVNFAENVQAAQTINGWVEDNTNDKIKNLIAPDSISDDTKMVLVNALYFSGKWVSRFEDYETTKKKFYKSKADTVDVDTMHQVEYLNYYENPALKAKFLELPYQGADITMVIVLPDEIEGLGALEQNIEQVLEPQPFTKERVDVDLPKFTIETEIKFVPILKSLGIQRIFSDSADLSGLSSTHKDLYVSDVIQKAFINVTETGTEAAAATAVGIALLSAPILGSGGYIFRADHPFIYYIRENRSGGLLFVGRYNQN
ncbi:hypothetical protein NQ318_012370 [Aromia moschata]|uniref:Serpin domain-containing protein n=1 Tax=Aromia moschata TaxID=1265417 RepID=A0AAV8Y4T4_9CUCU|nr:hypothetical protein NQ318_012370 [Aromia moschata]